MVHRNVLYVLLRCCALNIFSATVRWAVEWDDVTANSKWKTCFFLPKVLVLLSISNPTLATHLNLCLYPIRRSFISSVSVEGQIWGLSITWWKMVEEMWHYAFCSFSPQKGLLTLFFCFFNIKLRVSLPKQNMLTKRHFSLCWSNC